jgi:hypothetical protein
VQIKIVVLLITLTMFAQTKAAESYGLTGHILQTRCTDQLVIAGTNISSLICGHYIASMTDFMADLKETNIIPSSGGFCLPKNTSIGQLNMIFIKFANSHPELLHLRASSVVMLAFREAFPCE